MTTQWISVWKIVMVAIIPFLAAMAQADQSEALAFAEAYPYLATGILKSARLAKLEKGVVFTAGEVKITETALLKIVNTAEPELGEQLKKNLLFVLEQHAAQKLLFHEAYKVSRGTLIILKLAI